MFPSVPAEAAETILAHSFLKGSGRVGRSQKLDEEVRIELAVNAYIRHACTDYEAQLRRIRATIKHKKSNIKDRARSKVYEQVKNIADSWRSKKVPQIDVSTRSYDLRAATKVAKAAKSLSKRNIGLAQSKYSKLSATCASRALVRILKFGALGS